MANVIIGEARAGQASIRSSGGQPTLEETYNFLVKAESRETSRLSVLLTPGLPVTGVTVSAFGLSVCNGKTATRRENQPLYWDVTTTFSSEVEERQSNQNPSSNPVEWVPIYETKFERMQEVATKDTAGASIANSAGQAFEDGIARNRFIPVWEFFQFDPATVTDETIIGRNEVVNSAVFKGRAAHTLLCTVMSSVIGFYYGTRLRFTQYALRYNDQNWKHKRLDVGTTYLTGGNLKPVRDADGNSILGSLNGSGGLQASGTAPATLEFAMYPEVNFDDFLRV